MLVPAIALDADGAAQRPDGGPWAVSAERLASLHAALEGLVVADGGAPSAAVHACVQQVAGAWVVVPAAVDADAAVRVLDSGAAKVVASAEHLASWAGQVPAERVVVRVSGASSVSAAVSSASTGGYSGVLVDACDGDVAALAALPRPPLGVPVVALFATAPSAAAVAALDAAGVDLASTGVHPGPEEAGPVGALLPAAAGFCAALKTDRADGLFATVVADEHGVALGLVYSSAESIAESLRTRRGVYQSRSRGLWRKGETTGAIQELVSLAADCDRDALRFVVRQRGKGFCHLETRSCFDGGRAFHPPAAGGIAGLFRVLQSRRETAPAGSYTARLFADNSLLRAKLIEEAHELAAATTPEEVAAEAADVLYFALVRCAGAGVELEDVARVLDRRHAKVTRRPGNAKPAYVQAAAASPAATAPTAAPAHATSRDAPVSDGPILAEHQFSALSPADVARLCRRPAQENPAELQSRVAAIVERVRREGDKALLELTARFDGAQLASPVMPVPRDPAQLPPLAPEVRAAIDIAFENIRKFHAAQLHPAPLVVETCPGVTCSRIVRAVERVGLYVPGGSAVLPSTALMLGIPAQVAGCARIVVASPPRRDGSVAPEVAYVAHRVGAECIVLAGGAQAVAALAYGTESVPKVDKICGPGNQYVTAAKMLVQNDNTAMVSIDMPAGPSEVMVVADSSADPVFVAADLLSQAEHGPDSQVVLVACAMGRAGLDAIHAEVDRQVRLLPRERIARAALSKSFAVCVADMGEAMRFANAYAPEHLILNVRDAESHVDAVQHAGSVFLGPYSAESCGDYASGTNHTLPTYGYARMYSGVSTASFQKHITTQTVTAEGIRSIGDAVATLAAVEGLDAHRNAVVLRKAAIDAANR